MIFFHSILSSLSFLYPLIPIVWISSSMSSIHLFVALHLILLPIDFHSNILLGILLPSLCITCRSQAILLLFINLTMSALSMSSFSSWFFLILQIPFSSCAGPKIFLIVVHFDLLMSRPHICMLQWVLLRFHIFLVLNFYLMLLISLVFHMNGNISFRW